MKGALYGLMSRMTAAALALALSGVPKLVDAAVGPPGHRCRCPAGVKHACECPLCHAGAARAETDDEKLPPCHRALAARARAEQRESQRRAASKPCLTGTCGTGDRLLVPAELDDFLLPRAPALAVIQAEQALAPRAGACRQAVREPETPPPRAG